MEGVDASFKVGEYWNPKTQIDVVGIRDDNWIDLGECKWGAVRSAKAVEKELRSKTIHYPNPQDYTISYHIFSRNPVRKKQSRDSSVRWHSLKELYSK
jgi:hypothetical protein